MRHVTRFFRFAAFAAATVAFSGTLLAQTPTPTPTATPTPTPTPVPSLAPASVGSIGIPSGGRYDASNMILETDGTIWTASANENVLSRISADEKKVTKWAMPRDAAPSHLLKEADGTLWIAQLGGFKISRFDPASAELTEWPDAARRPTAFVKKADGTLWLPETNGTLTNFDPATGTLVYWRSTDTENPISSLTYPFLDSDGSVWSADFLRGNLLRFAADGSRVTKWELPDVYASPSKIIRGPDGAIWMSLYSSGQLARFDPATAEFKAYTVGTFVLPFDLKIYKDRIVYTEQQSGEVGVFEPLAFSPASTNTLVPKEVTLTSTTETVASTKTKLVATELDTTAGAPVEIPGAAFPGLVRYPAMGGTAGYALVIDETRKRFLVGATASVLELLPPVPSSADDQLYPAAASIGGQGGSRWTTQTVGWNRGTADTAGATVDATVDERLLPNDWIAGLSPTTTLKVAPGALVSQDDPIGTVMGGKDTSGALRFSSAATTTKFADFYSWIRVSRTRADGGTYGFARNFVKGAQGIGAGETGFLFTPPDAATQRTNAGLFVVAAAAGTVSIVDSTGALLGGPFAFSWPAGYHAQASTIFAAFGIPPSPSARVVFAVTTGRVLPFGTSIDSVSGDPVDLPFFGPKSTAQYQWILGAERGAGPLSTGSRTDLQLFNGAATDSAVTLSFHAAHLASAPPIAVPAPSVTLTVPAGKGVTLADVLKDSFGVEAAAGSIAIASDPPVFAFARVTAPDAGGGRHGFGFPGLLGDAAPAAGSRGVFIQATDSGWNVILSELQVTNPTDGPADVTVRTFDAGGTAVGTPLTLAVGPKEVVRIPSAFYTIAGFGTPLGRLEVVPATGSQPVFATLVRQDMKTGDADAIVPYIVPAP